MNVFNTSKEMLPKENWCKKKVKGKKLVFQIGIVVIFAEEPEGFLRKMTKKYFCVHGDQ